MYDDNFVIELKTSNIGTQNRYSIKDYQGNTVFSKNGLSSNTTYKDTLNLVNGCYTIELIDTGNDGLSWWANTSQGTGYFRLRSVTGQILKTFNPDFGSSIIYSFTIGSTQNISPEVLDGFEFNLFPNPTSDRVYISLKGIKSDMIIIHLTDILGNVLESRDDKIQLGRERIDVQIKSLIEKNKLISDLQQKLGEDSDQDFPSKILTNDDWVSFRSNVELIEPDLILRIEDKFPKISNAELRLTLLLRLNFDSFEISNILGISKDSVQKARTRLRKKLELSSSNNLESFIKSI